ncbi:MAG: hypothetical protein R2828_04800 [Saprospiraceae bacterium]
MTTQKTTKCTAIQLKTTPFVVAEVVFGSPKKNCAGIGICKVSPVENVLPSLPCRSVTTEIAAIKNNVLRLRLSMQGLCANMIDRQFSQGRFKMEESFQLPAWLVDQLQLSANQVKRGTYTLVFEEQHIIISLRLG